MNYETFMECVERFRLEPRKCSPVHWQIRGGRRLVNVWPNTKRGFRFQASGQAVRTGVIGEAITAAGPTIGGSPPWEDEPVPTAESPLPPDRVGLIRWLWRIIW